MKLALRLVTTTPNNSTNLRDTEKKPIDIYLAVSLWRLRCLKDHEENIVLITEEVYLGIINLGVKFHCEYNFLLFLSL